MGFMEFLTLVFVVLKLVEVIDWSWWLVLLPEILAFVFYISIFLIGVFAKLHTPTKRRSNKWQ